MINNMCLNCSKYRTSCSGETNNTFTGCVYKTIQTDKRQALQVYKDTKAAWHADPSRDNWIAFCDAKITCRRLGVMI